ncbi:importin subunit alpha-7 [Anaeramoeba flamelloides]|uniref:Importin subunit alpha-7 n=1 Tax=Anaeramoeba flamelloides TaxID=1746091 RepID=A0AAV8A1Z9_9EUKA|nr:importin subunit alpha-7 [Anaeramoeba flamelloides]
MTEFSLKLDRRKKNFKKKTNRNESIQKRTKKIINNSLNQREQLLSQKRIKNLNESFEESDNDKIKEDIPTLINHLVEGDIIKKTNSLKSIKQLTCIISPILQELFENGLGQALIYILTNVTNKYILIDTFSLLNNLTIGKNDHIELLVQTGIIKVLMSFVKCQDDAVMENVCD